MRLLKNGATSLKFYALMLPGQTFGTNRAMMSLHIGDTHFTYTPGTAASGNTGSASSPKTFDAGIAMYVGMALTSVAGSAVVIGKKKEF